MNQLENDAEYAGVDFGPLKCDLEWPSKSGHYRSDTRTVRERAKQVRNWLHSRPEREIVVVAHGDMLRYITRGVNTYEDWPNGEIREYVFGKEDGQLEFVRDNVGHEGKL